MMTEIQVGDGVPNRLRPDDVPGAVNVLRHIKVQGSGEDIARQLVGRALQATEMLHSNTALFEAIQIARRKEKGYEMIATFDDAVTQLMAWATEADNMGMQVFPL